VRWPTLALPLFAMRASARLWPEVRAARPGWGGRLAFAAAYGLRTLRSPASPRRMAAWAREWQGLDLVDRFRTIAAPTLVITGEPGLDRVVPVASSLEYLGLIPGAEHTTLASTGHIGLILRPETFAAVVSEFVQRRRL
jgi:pimeloyl-ACP methyl ester carboxylesterase